MQPSGLPYSAREKEGACRKMRRRDGGNVQVRAPMKAPALCAKRRCHTMSHAGDVFTAIYHGRTDRRSRADARAGNASHALPFVGCREATLKRPRITLINREEGIMIVPRCSRRPPARRARGASRMLSHDIQPASANTGCQRCSHMQRCLIAGAEASPSFVREMLRLNRDIRTSVIR